MGMRGPAKKPAHLKLIAGTTRDDRPEDPPAVAGDQALVELPDPPDWLPNEEAKNEWRKIGVLLVERGQLDTSRLMSLGIYCSVAGKIAQKFRAGEMPAAHLLAQFKALGKEIGVLTTASQQSASTKPAGSSRLASLKERAQRTD
jgi:phage terminase small subunit